jgi:hypothetical protein
MSICCQIIYYDYLYVVKFLTVFKLFWFCVAIYIPLQATY